MTSRAQSDARGENPMAWATFAGIMLFLGGSFNAIFGLTAIFDDKVLTRVGGALLFWDYTIWGWIHLISGILMLVASFGLFAGRPGAAMLAILLPR